MTPSGPEKAINFWLAARSFAAVALLCAAFWPRRWSLAAGPPSRYAGLLGVLLLVGAVHYVLLAQPQWVPRTFLPGLGLTPFKVNFEYTLIALYVLAGAGFLLRLRDARESGVERLALASFTMAMSEYFFTLYANVSELGFTFHGYDQVQDGSGYLRWTLHYRHPRLSRGQRIDVAGCSHLLWHEKVYQHRDYFDAGALLYEHLPLMGPAIGWLKGRLA